MTPHGIQFPPPILQAIHQAQALGGYRVRILAKEDGSGRDRCIVLCGESHRKGRVARDAGVELRRQFPFWGYEETQGEGLERWLLSKIIHARDRVMGILPFFRYASTIDERISLAGEISVWLEEGHRPTRAEKVSLQLTVAEACFLPMSSLIDGLCHSSPELLLLQELAVGVARWHIELGIVGILLTIFGVSLPLQSRLGSFLVPALHGMVYGRDRTMGDNLAQAFEGHPQFSWMLGLMGSGHLVGVSERLVSLHGFRRIPIPPRPTHTPAT